MRQPSSERFWGSAKRRFLAASLEAFLARELGRSFGAVVRQAIVKELMELIERAMPAREHLKPGQVVWNAVSVRTRPDSPACKLVPVVLTLVAEEDVAALSKGVRMREIAKRAVARITREAYEQGGLLSMRDISLFTWSHEGRVSEIRKRHEEEQGVVLPHTGSLQDMGTCVTHKRIIVRKAVKEKKDPTVVARETRHSQRAVDSYLRDYHRVKTCYEHRPDIEFVAHVTGCSTRLVRQYVDIIHESQQNV